MIRIIALIIKRKFFFELHKSLDLHCWQTVINRTTHAAKAKLVPTFFHIWMKLWLLWCNRISLHGLLYYLFFYYKAWIYYLFSRLNLQLMLCYLWCHINSELSIHVIIRPDEGVGPNEFISLHKVDRTWVSNAHWILMLLHLWRRHERRWQVRVHSFDHWKLFVKYLRFY